MWTTAQKIRGALRAAQPIISAAVIDAIMELKELTEAIETVADKMDAKIDGTYSATAIMMKNKKTSLPMEKENPPL